MEKLRRFIDAQGINDREFARRARISPATVSRLLSGKKPTVESAIRIEEATSGFVAVKDWAQPVKAAE